MTSGKTALYLAGGALFVACLAAANMPAPQTDRSDAGARQPEPVSPSALADEVRSQASRLQSRMAEAPVPENSARNPFTFAVLANKAHSTREIRAAAVEEAAAALPVPAPALTLMGIAEESI